MSLIYESFYEPGEHLWTVPPGIYSLTITCLGAGGDGGESAGLQGGYGGGSGGVGITQNMAVTPGTVFRLRVAGREDQTPDDLGNLGCDSWFRLGSTVYCKGAGAYDFWTGAIAGDCIGDVTLAGGDGQSPWGQAGGGGGSSPNLVFPYSDGSDGVFQDPGPTGTFIGGRGGDSGSPGQPGESAADPPMFVGAGGGGGGGEIDGVAGGLGGNGWVLLAYEGAICGHCWLTTPVVGLLRTDFDGDPLTQIQLPSSQFDLEILYIPDDVETVFYTETTGRLLAQPLHGGPPLVVLRTSTSFRGLSLDRVFQELYLIENSGSSWQLSKITIFGTEYTVLTTTGLTDPQFIAVDPLNLYLFVTDLSGGEVLRFTTDGGNRVVLDTDGSEPRGIVVDTRDLDNMVIYWCDSGTGCIYRSNQSGLFKTTIYTGTGGADPTGLYLDTEENRLWWTEPGLDLIRSCNLDGSDVRTQFTMETGDTPWGVELCGSPSTSGTTPDPSTSTTTTTPDPSSTTTTTTPNPGGTTTTTTPDPSTTTTTSTTRAPDATLRHGREQIAVDQPEGGINYPFLLPSDHLGELLGDLYLAFHDQDFVPPFSLQRLKNFQPSAAQRYELRIVDAEGTLVFDTENSDPALFQQYVWTTGKKILEYGDSAGQILRVVVFTAWDSEDTPLTWAATVTPTDGRLDSRALDPIPPQVLQLVVRQPNGDEVELPVGRNVIFQGGYNTELVAAERTNTDGGVYGYTLTLDATPGGGLGQYPGCSENLFLQTINQVEPDSQGNLRIEYAGSQIANPDNQSCYRIERPLETVLTADTDTEFQQVTVEPSTLKIYNNCSPCCTCDDFVRVYEAIRRLYNRYKQLGIRAEAARDQYALNKDRWLANRTCREKTLLRASLLPLGRCRLGIAAGICNNQDTSILGTRLKLDFTASDVTGCVRCDTVFRYGNTDPVLPIPSSRAQSYQLTGTWPIFYAEHDCISQGELGYIVGQLQFPAGTDGDVIRLTLSLDGYNPGSAQPISLEATLRCSANDDAMCCAESDSTTTTPAP